jgi:hypothetical protein
MSTLVDAEEAVQALDAAILQHIRAHPKAHPMSSPSVRRLAALTEPCLDGQIPCRVIERRMKAIRGAGKIAWDRSKGRYKVLG